MLPVRFLCKGEDVVELALSHFALRKILSTDRIVLTCLSQLLKESVIYEVIQARQGLISVRKPCNALV